AGRRRRSGSACRRTGRRSRSRSRCGCCRIRACRPGASTPTTERGAMGFRFRLASFFVAALVVVQGLTALLVYQVARRELVDEGRRQLQVASSAFVHQLGDVSARVADSVNLLALDYALRASFAQRDEATLLSALRNHGRRVGASQMLAVDVDGRVQADTRGDYRAGVPFPYADLTDRALERPAAAVVAWKGGAYWMVVV